MSTAPESPAALPVGALLRSWRERRRLSQLDLSIIADVSTRHLSYVETGRSRPTAEMILRLAEHLDVPLPGRNALLHAGGFAPAYSSFPADSAALDAVMTGLRDLLDAHLPYPALLLDDGWDVIDSNEAVNLLLDGCAPELLEPPVNALRLSLHPGGLAPRIRNLESWGSSLLHQVRQRAEREANARLATLAEELSAYVPSPERRPAVESPVLALELDGGLDQQALRFVSIAARLETPADTTLSGLVLETFLPADAHTREAMGASAPG